MWIVQGLAPPPAGTPEPPLTVQFISFSMVIQITTDVLGETFVPPVIYLTRQTLYIISEVHASDIEHHLFVFSLYEKDVGGCH